MNFKEVFIRMKNGSKFKRPNWSGYWEWDPVTEAIMMYCKPKESDDGMAVLDIRATQRVEYTINNILADDWMEATSENTPILGGSRKLSFADAFRMMYEYKKSIKLPHMTGNMHIELRPDVNNEVSPHLVTKYTEMPWYPSQKDVSSNEWEIID